MSQHRRISRITVASVAFCVAFVTLVVARSPLASAGSLQGSIVISPNTSTTQNNYLESTSCTSTSFCVAVGYYYTGSYYQTLIEEWNGTSWSIVTSPNTSTTLTNELFAVSCTSTSFCMASGNSVSSGGYDQTLAEEWNGSIWSIVTTPPVGGANNDGDLFGIVCQSTADCIAVGNSVNSGGYDQTLVEEWNGSSWSIVTSPDTSTTQSNDLDGVSCTSTPFCMAVGYYYTGSYQTLVEEWNGSSWSIVSSPNAASTTNELDGVSCSGTTACMAVGVDVLSGYYQTLIEQWNGSSWSIVTSPNGTTSSYGNYLNGVSCTGTTFCMAVGYYSTGVNVGQTMVEEWNGTSWSLISSPDVGTSSNDLYGVDCVSSSWCVAVGNYLTAYSGGYEQTLVVEYAMVCSGGSLSLSSPSSANWPSVTLNGTNQSSILSLTLVPDDETGTGNGWNIDVTSTTFANGSSDTLPTSASTVTGVASVTAPTGNCSLPTNTISPYPITVPAGTTAPTAVPIFSANTGTGEGPANVALNFAVAVPGYAYSGTYTSTWTFTIASGP